MVLRPFGSTWWRRPRMWWGIALLSLGIAAAAGWRWWSIVRDETLAADRGVIELPMARVMASPVLRFARAQALAAKNDVEGASAMYRSLRSDPHFGLAARYAHANVLMREAERLQSTDGGQSVALLELAKQGYRDVLRIDPWHWDARYNYERAQRIQPDIEDATPSIGGPRNDAERASITVRGVPQGLP